MEKQEWEELLRIRSSLNDNLMAYDADTQEKFTELLVKSLEGKGDRPIRAVSRTLTDGLPPFACGENAL